MMYKCIQRCWFGKKALSLGEKLDLDLRNPEHKKLVDFKYFVKDTPEDSETKEDVKRESKAERKRREKRKKAAPSDDPQMTLNIDQG